MVISFYLLKGVAVGFYYFEESEYNPEQIEILLFFFSITFSNEQ